MITLTAVPVWFTLLFSMAEHTQAVTIACLKFLGVLKL